MKKIFTITNNLNLRSEPSLQANILGQLNKNEIVRVIEFTSTLSWVKIERENNQIGWSSYKYFLGIPDSNLVRQNDFKWLKIAFAELGTPELEDPLENQRIVQYLKTCEYSLPHINEESDETNWCAAFTNWCIENAGYSGTNSAWALDWANWGTKAENLTRGSIAVFKRFVMSEGVKQTFGHVGFFLGRDQEDENKLVILGGNQGNTVSIKSYPIKSDEYEFVGFRKL